MYRSIKLMKVISATEFRKKQKYYLDLAQKECIVIKRGRNDAFAVIPLAKMDETEYLLSGDANAQRLKNTLENIKLGNDKGIVLNIEALMNFRGNEIG